MNVRRATTADRETLQRLAEEWAADVDRALDDGAALLAEGAEPMGFALVFERAPGVAHVSDVYVRPQFRRRGVGRALMREVVGWARGQGHTTVSLMVEADNRLARSLYQRLGFQAEAIRLVADLGAVDAALAQVQGAGSFGSVHVQTDNVAAVERAVREFIPRLPGRSRGSVVAPPRNGWIAVYDELADREPEMLRRVARELSSRMGAVVAALGVEEGEVVRYVLFERGRVVDEYLSVPDFHGPLPPGDVVALAANPTVAARLTGADPARVRAVARKGSSPSDLPPAPDLIAQLADALGLEGGGHGYAGAAELENAIVIPRG